VHIGDICAIQRKRGLTPFFQSGDTVIGSLPVNLAAEICQRGAAYIHMTLNVPEHWRGKELTVEQMIECGACLEGYELKKINCVQ
jgi:CRISPR-associated protein Csx16